MYLEIPKYASDGIYDLKIVISNDRFSEYADELDEIVHRYQLGFVIGFDQFFVEKLNIKNLNRRKVPNFAEHAEQTMVNLSIV